jgi:hypothetical protein
MDPDSVVALKTAFATASGWSEWCTIAVTVGVFVELVALFVFSKDLPSGYNLTQASGGYGGFPPLGRITPGTKC